jgi:hypothetical protein
MTALPFVFLTGDLHVISSLTLQNEDPPPDFRPTKLFFKPQVEAIKAELVKTQSMGEGTADEWAKGLEGVGVEKRNDVFRWERWEAAGGVQRMRTKEPVEVQDLFQKFRNATSGPQASVSIAKPQPIPIPQKLQVSANGYHQPAPGTFSHQPIQSITAAFCKSLSICSFPFNF